MQPWNRSLYDQAAAHTVASVAPTVLHLTAPNNFKDASWSVFNAATNLNNLLAPDSTNSASDITSTVTGGFAALRTTIPSTMVSGTHYSLTGYIKNTTVPVWCSVVIFDDIGAANFVQYWFDTTAGAGAIGAASGTLGGAVDAGFAGTAAGNNYSKFDMFFHFTSTPTSSNLVDIRFVDANNGSTPTNLQQYYVWGWGA